MHALQIEISTHFVSGAACRRQRGPPGNQGDGPAVAGPMRSFLRSGRPLASEWVQPSISLAHLLSFCHHPSAWAVGLAACSDCQACAYGFPAARPWPSRFTSNQPEMSTSTQLRYPITAVQSSSFFAELAGKESYPRRLVTFQVTGRSNDVHDSDGFTRANAMHVSPIDLLPVL
jgi:hypothetical protein